MLGFGTYGRTGIDGQRAIEYALEIGYRHLDTAQSYDTEHETGAALKASGVDRDSVFVTTKVTPENFAPGKLVPSLERSLGQLGLDQVDLALIHWPAPNGDRPLRDYLPQLVQAQEAGLTRLIGVSNFTISMLGEALDTVGRDTLFTNQIECNPLFQNRNVTDWCKENGILVTCYQPLAKGLARRNSTLNTVAERLGATPEQVALAYELAHGFAAIPTSSQPQHITSNFEAQKLRLSPADLSAIAKIPANSRSIDPDWGPDWDPNR
ncbi:aldo/keto reductase (plasmid) [Qingshengfaniella alkalisoli]|uniref:Aldo/keto reductase n=2 Tax=Qingshengfaniella alkalisoli TaxID=2599296 RepID=A0A5B8IX33_9RHOB|nr:aldo/keto reductase [Qingshengfaniella alkalisoli]